MKDFEDILKFYDKGERFTKKSISFEIDELLGKLKIESVEVSDQSQTLERQNFELSKEETKQLIGYLTGWVLEWSK